MDCGLVSPKPRGSLANRQRRRGTGDPEPSDRPSTDGIRSPQSEQESPTTLGCGIHGSRRSQTPSTRSGAKGLDSIREGVNATFNPSRPSQSYGQGPLFLFPLSSIHRDSEAPLAAAINAGRPNGDPWLPIAWVK